jgi:trimeric autotransporter adhesin
MTETTEIDVYQIRPGTAYQIVGTNSGATQDVYLTLSGTGNEIIVTNTGTTITLSTPQAIGTGSSPTFASETLSNTTNQLVLGTTHTVTISSTAPSASRTYTIPDAGTSANVVLDQGNYTIGGTWTFNNPVTISDGNGVIFNDTEGTPKTVTVEAPTTITTSYTLKWPIIQGGSSTFLENDGSGNLSWSSGTGANTSLSNLSSVAINTSLLPASNAFISLGSSSLDWLDTYAEINQIAQAQAGNQTIASGFNASVPISHSIPVGHTLFVTLGSFFQIT